MKKDHWLQSALTNDDLVAELLLRLKHSSNSDSDSLRAPPSPPLTTETAITTHLPPRWGNRKNRSKSTAPTTSVATGYRKEHRGSPTTHLSWSGGSTSDGYEESGRPSDLSFGSRSVKELASMRANLNQQMEICSVKAETEGRQRGFVLPDLNMEPDEEDQSMMMS